MKKKLPFTTADILLPKENFEKWSVIACDQFTSEPEYWENVRRETEGAPSALDIILPEVYLGCGDTDMRIEKINRTMDEYLRDGIFNEYKDALIYVERTISDGRVRRGIVGAINLDDYSYESKSDAMIRSTEGTVLSRIPPRVKIRRDASLELPHVMLLIDDAKKNVIENIGRNKMRRELLYDFDLVAGGGHLRGFLIPKEEQQRIFEELENLAGDDENPLLFAVGDGNHSLATAKACSELSSDPRAKFALVEVVNIHDDALDFEPIYRVMFGIDPEDVIREAKLRFADCKNRKITYVANGLEGNFFTDGLESADLQAFIDEYIASHTGASVDYIHGEDSARALSQKENAIGFLFGGISKSELFPYVKKYGALPRKTFSMGEARDKRYYTECRRIK